MKELRGKTELNNKAKRRRALPLHLMLLPAVIVVFIYSYIPMFGICIAFMDFDVGLGFQSPWVGLENFRYILNLPGSLQVLRNTLLISFFKIAGMIVVPVTFALLLNEIGNKLFKRVFQTLIYVPHFLSWIIISGILIDILSPSSGIVNDVIKALGFEPIFFLGDKFWFPITMVVSDIWKGFGYGTIVYLAALTGIDQTLYEAAMVDGAGKWKQVVHITIPGILPIIILMSVLSLGNILNAGFDQVYNLYSAQVYETGDIIDTFVYRLGIQQGQFGPATAVGLFKSIVSMIFVLASYKLADKFAGYRIF